MQVVRVLDDLPEGFDDLRAEALVEGVRNMTLLGERWAAGEDRFDQPGEALFAAFIKGGLAGMGGVSIETGAGEPAMRMRRLYVVPSRRRAGVARTLAGAMIHQGLEAAPLLTANAKASPAAAPFWEAMGFEAAEAPGYTHTLRR